MAISAPPGRFRRATSAAFCLLTLGAIGLASAAGAPAQDDREVALFVGGRFGNARILALDAQGRTLASGEGKGIPRLIATCPGGERLAEVVHLRSDNRMRATYEIAIREATSLGVVRRLAFELPGWRFATSSLCEDNAGTRVVIFASGAGDAPQGAAIYRLTGRRLTTVWKGTAHLSSLNLGVAYVNSGYTTARLVGIDLRTKRVSRLAWLPRSPRVVPDRTGRRLAGVAYSLAEKSRLVALDLASRPAKVRSTPLDAPEVFGDVFWISDGLVFLPGAGQETAVVLDHDLRARSRFRWSAGSPAIVGTTVYGIRRVHGTLVAAPLSTGPMRIVRGLPGTPVVLVAARG